MAADEILTVRVVSKDGGDYICRCPHCGDITTDATELDDVRGQQYQHITRSRFGKSGCGGWLEIADNARRVGTLPPAAPAGCTAPDCDCEPGIECAARAAARARGAQGCERGRGDPKDCGASPACGCPAALAAYGVMAVDEAQAKRISDALRAMQEMWDHLRRKGLSDVLMREYSNALEVLEDDFRARLPTDGVRVPDGGEQ